MRRNKWVGEIGILCYIFILFVSLQNIDPPNGIPSITEEMLLKNGSFICYQVQLADSEADSDTKIISISPAIEELGRKINYDFTVEIDIDSEDAEDDYDSDDDLIIKRTRLAMNWYILYKEYFMLKRCFKEQWFKSLNIKLYFLIIAKWTGLCKSR